jgi:hypothetical protein
LVELAEDGDGLSLWGPFSVDISVAFFVDAVSLVALGDIIEAIFGLKL